MRSAAVAVASVIPRSAALLQQEETNEKALGALKSSVRVRRAPLSVTNLQPPDCRAGRQVLRGTCDGGWGSALIEC